MEDKYITVIIAVFSVLLFLGFFATPMMGYGNYKYGMMSGFNCFGSDQFSAVGYGLMFLVMVVFWILVITALILFIIWLVRQLQRDDNHKIKRRTR